MIYHPNDEMACGDRPKISVLVSVIQLLERRNHEPKKSTAKRCNTIFDHHFPTGYDKLVDNIALYCCMVLLYSFDRNIPDRWYRTEPSLIIHA